MSVSRLRRFDAEAPSRLAARADFGKPLPAPPAETAAVSAPDPHAILFRNACARLIADLEAAERTLRAEAADALERIVQTVAPTLLAHGSRGAIASLLEAFKGGDIAEIEIAASSATLEMLKDHPAGVRLVCDESFAPGDFEARWPKGGMIRDADALMQGLLAALSASKTGAADG
jgi:hypothetical protein